MFLNKCRYAFFLYLATTTFSIEALSNQLTLTLAEPNWTFLIQNSAINPSSLTPVENSFVQDLQPLLKAKNYQAVDNKLQTFSNKEESGTMLLLRGQIALSLQQFEKAKVALSNALKQEPKLAVAHSSLALVYLRDNQFEKALSHLQSSIELGAFNAQIIGQLAFVNMQLGYAASAVAGFRQAMFLETTNSDWQQGLLFSLVHSKAYTQATALADQMLAETPLNKELWLLRSQIALQSGQNIQALSSLESALTLGENSPSNVMTAVQLHLASGSPKRAIELLKRPEVLNQSITADHLSQLQQITNWLAAEKQWDNLAILLKGRNKLSLSDELNATFSIGEARLALHKGQQSEAEKMLITALEFAPAHGEALIEFAKLLKTQKRHTQALQYYIRAEALPDYRERALLGRANIAINQSDYAKALQLVGQVSRENPKRTDLLSTIETLKSLVRNNV